MWLRHWHGRRDATVTLLICYFGDLIWKVRRHKKQSGWQFRHLPLSSYVSIDSVYEEVQPKTEEEGDSGDHGGRQHRPVMVSKIRIERRAKQPDLDHQ